ncbi:nitroreductase [Methylocystis sp. JAN1]|uniref:nitroreductase family protein n=1 Tax=Methylocystis sp. JAN1 TaxID=3397211 RepID=UPI003FA260EA
MDALEAIDTRSSVSALAEPGPTDAQWAALLRAAGRAPDHARLRPSRFLIVRGEARRRLGDVLADALLAGEPEAPPEAVNRERQKPLRAPAILIVAATPKPHPKVPEIEQMLAAGAATQNVLLAAHAMGLGAIWRTGAPAYDPRVVAALGLPPQSRIVGFVYLGTPVAGAKRKDVGDAPAAVEWGETPKDFAGS